MIKFHKNYFIESKPYEPVNPSRKQNNDFRNNHNIEKKLTRFRIYQETEIACKYRNPVYKTQYSEMVTGYKYEKGFDMTTGKIKFDDSKSTRLQELSLMNNTYFGVIHYDNHFDMKLDYTISRIFQDMSLSELETLHQLCELERTQILQSLALAVLKLPYAGYLLSGNRSNFLDYEGNILCFTLAPKK